MSTPRKLGVLFCLLGLVAVCVLAIVLNTTGPFAGLPGIESSLEAEARAVVANRAAAAAIRWVFMAVSILVGLWRVWRSFAQWQASA